MNNSVKVLFLHHSTGNNVWRGNVNKYLYKLTKKGQIQKWFSNYNKNQKTKILIEDQFFPSPSPYGWKNYPYDYYNIWVKHAGDSSYMNEPTLEILTKQYDVIIFKHCFPGSNILADTGNPSADSEVKTLANYKLQYNLLKEKMHAFPNTKFIVWTLAALTEKNTNAENASRAREFYKWVKEEWDEKGDNIYLFDFYQLETEGGLYLKPEFASSDTDSHPNKAFSAKIAPIFCQRIVDVIHEKN